MSQSSQRKTVASVIGDELEYERQITWLIHDVHWALSKDLEKEAQVLGLSKAKWRVLAHLSRGDPVTQTDLAEKMGVEKAPLGRMLDKLEADGFIERRPSPEDRRAKLVLATPKIDNLAEEMLSLTSGVFEVALKDVKAKDLANLVKTLKTIQKNLAS
jgi:MarR family transcriptional regulator, transcriptional regulator for hemolysin